MSNRSINASGRNSAHESTSVDARETEPDRSRGGVDWEQAFLFYASLPPGQRSYAAVAAKFGGSSRTVETHGRTDGWKTRLRRVEQEAMVRNEELLVSGRVEEVRTIRRLINASLGAYAQRLQEGSVRIGPADLERLNRLSRAMLDELRETGQEREPSPEAPGRTPEHLAAVLEALAESGALEQFGLTRTGAEPPGPDEAGGAV